jgi:protein-S-isoprenylcysteine O-methyltransferase Ste14
MDLALIEIAAWSRRAINSAAFTRSLTSVPWLSRIRAVRGYDVAMGALGSAWFLVLALVVGLKAWTQSVTMSIGDFSSTGWPALLGDACMFLFYLALWWLILVRPSPATRTAGVLPSIIAFAGSYAPWAIVLFAPGDASEGPKLASAALYLIGTGLMIVVICHLGRSFSIVPQARRLVRTGPYAVIRNPLYLAEEVALFGALLQYFSPLVLALFLAHGALQIRRILYEESLLRLTFPDYEDYAKSTSRLIPRVW